MKAGQNLSRGRVKSPGLYLIQAFGDLAGAGRLFIFFDQSN